MNKKSMLKNYFDNTILNKITYLTILVLILYMFGQFLDFTKTFTGYKNVSVYDYMLFLFNQYIFIVFFLDLFFLVIIRNLINKSAYTKYLFLKFSNRKQLFFSNIIIICITSFLYVFIVVAITFLQGVLNLSIKNNWSNSSIIISKVMTTDITTCIKAVSPIFACSINYLLISLYIFSVGVLFYISSLFFRKTMMPFITTIIYILLGLMLYTDMGNSTIRFSLCENSMVYSQVWGTVNFLYQVIFKLAFWVVIISTLITLGLYRVKRVDFKFEGEK